MLLSEALEKFLLSLEADDRKDRTIGTYRQRIGDFQHFLKAQGITDLDEISRGDVDAWAVSMRRQERRWTDHPYKPSTNGGLSKSTRAGRIQAVQAFLSWCVEREHLDRSPAAHLKPPRLTRKDRSARNKLMTVEDLKRIEAEAERRAAKGQLRDLALVRFIADTGARRGEVARLQIANLDLEKREALVSGKTTGEEDVRPVDFGERTADAIGEWLDARPPTDHDYVFVSLSHDPERHGLRLEPGGVYQIFYRLARAAGVRGLFNPHALRHLVGQHFTDTTNLELTREKMGHENIQTTADFYAHQDRGRVKDATALHSLLNHIADE